MQIEQKWLCEKASELPNSMTTKDETIEGKDNHEKRISRGYIYL